MVAPIYSNRKGIYKDLYREIDSDNKKKTSLKGSPKGIYKDLYRQIEQETIAFKNNENNKQGNFFQSIKKKANYVLSKVSYVFSSARGESKPLILACFVANKSVNSYVGNTSPHYSRQGKRQRIYNDR